MPLTTIVTLPLPIDPASNCDIVATKSLSKTGSASSMFWSMVMASTLLLTSHPGRTVADRDLPSERREIEDEALRRRRPVRHPHRHRRRTLRSRREAMLSRTLSKWNAPTRLSPFA